MARVSSYVRSPKPRYKGCDRRSAHKSPARDSNMPGIHRPTTGIHLRDRDIDQPKYLAIDLRSNERIVDASLDVRLRALELWAMQVACLFCEDRERLPRRRRVDIAKDCRVFVSSNEFRDLWTIGYARLTTAQPRYGILPAGNASSSFVEEFLARTFRETSGWDHVVYRSLPVRLSQKLKRESTVLRVRREYSHFPFITHPRREQDWGSYSRERLERRTVQGHRGWA